MRDLVKMIKSSMVKLITYEKIHFGDIIGRGSFGVVYRASYENKLVAVKELHNICLMNSDSLGGIFLLISNLKSL